jgi:hypothetical protein
MRSDTITGGRSRALLTNRRIREYLDQRHAKSVARFETIIAEAKG